MHGETVKFKKWTQYTSEKKFAINNLFLLSKLDCVSSCCLLPLKIIIGWKLKIKERDEIQESPFKRNGYGPTTKRLNSTDHEHMFNNTVLGLINTFTSYFRNDWMTDCLPTVSAAEYTRYIL